MKSPPLTPNLYQYILDHCGQRDPLLEELARETAALGPVTVIDLAGEPLERKLLASTLQGVVNRSLSRIYLLDGI